MTGPSRIQTGGKEPVEVLVLDIHGDPLSGGSNILLKIRRQSDNAMYDWSDNSFKTPSSVSQLEQALSEIDPIRCPGEYKLNTVDHVNGFDTMSVTNPEDDDIYEFTVDQPPGGEASNLPLIGEVKVGSYVDDIPDFTQNERTELKAVLGITGTGTPNDSPTSGALSLILGLVQNNFFLDGTSYNAQGLLVAGRIRIFPTKGDTDLATDGGAGEGELASFNIVTEPEAAPLDGLAKTYKVTRE